jgi:hypothetical protein
MTIVGKSYAFIIYMTNFFWPSGWRAIARRHVTLKISESAYNALSKQLQGSSPQQLELVPPTHRGPWCARTRWMGSAHQKI